MTGLMRRVDAFTSRVRWLGPFMGGVVPAASFLVKARKDPAARAEARFSPFNFVFRGADLSALRELLLDREYAFLRPVLEGCAAPVILDVGAHIGLFAIWALSEKPASRILSVEADPATFAILSENMARSPSLPGSWTAVNRAAWKDGAPVRFSDAGDAMSHRVSATGRLSVAGITLEELIDMAAPTGAVDLLKVDIEGAEEAFLCDGSGGLARVGNLVIELHPDLCDACRVDELLRRSFASVERIGGRTSSKPLLLCRR